MQADALLHLGANAEKAAAAAVDRTTQRNSESDARKAAADFESVFLTTFLEGMFAGVKTDPPFGGGNSEKIYRSMLLGEFAKDIAANGGLGIADHVYRELLSVQENSLR